MRIIIPCMFVPVLLVAAELPQPVIPQGIGVNIHFTRGHEKDLDLIAAAGFRVVRMDFSWAGTERQKGSYDWSAYDELTSALVRRGIRPYYILDYSNPLYEEEVVGKDPVFGRERRDTASPQHPESVAAFARWAAAAVRHFAGKQIIWELWNEPNIGFWKPKPDAAQYASLLRAVAPSVREADAEVTLVAPATSGLPWPFLEELFKDGALSRLDAVSVHPYREYQHAPETAAADYQRLRELITRYAADAPQKQLPILSGEWGYASHARGVSPETQAAFAARQQLVNLLCGVPVSIWYDWKNDGPDPAEREHNFGTVTENLQPKPAYRAIQTLTRELSGFRVVKRLSVGSPADYVVRLVDAAGKVKLALWTTAAPHSLQLPTRSPAPAATRLVTSDGRQVEVNATSTAWEIELTSAPQYLSSDTVEPGE